MNDFFKHIDQDSEYVLWKIIAQSPARNARVEAIKNFRNTYGTGLKEAKDVVEEFVRRLGNGDSTTRIVNLGDGSELQITTLFGQPKYYEVKRVTVFGQFTEGELLQAVANAARESVPYNGPRA